MYWELAQLTRCYSKYQSSDGKCYLQFLPFSSHCILVSSQPFMWSHHLVPLPIYFHLHLFPVKRTASVFATMEKGSPLRSIGTTTCLSPLWSLVICWHQATTMTIRRKWPEEGMAMEQSCATSLAQNLLWKQLVVNMAKSSSRYCVLTLILMVIAAIELQFNCEVWKFYLIHIWYLWFGEISVALGPKAKLYNSLQNCVKKGKCSEKVSVGPLNAVHQLIIGSQLS